MALLEETERLCRELGNEQGLSTSLGNQATILYARGELDRAMSLLLKTELRYRQFADKHGLSKSLSQQAAILQAKGDVDRPLALHKEAESLCRELGDQRGLAVSLANHALLLSRNPESSGEAKRLVEEALVIADRHGYEQLTPRFQRIQKYLKDGRL